MGQRAAGHVVEGTRAGLNLSTTGWSLPRETRADLDAPLSVLDLTARPFNALEKLGIRTVRQLLSTPKAVLLQTDGLGSKSMAEVERALRDYFSGGKRTGSPAHRAATLGLLEPSVGTKSFVNRMLSCLPDGERTIILDRYGLWDGTGETLQEIGNRMRLTRERIRQIEARGLNRLRTILGAPVITGFVRTKLERRLDFQAAETFGVLSEGEVLAVLGDDCTVEEARLAVALLADLCDMKHRLLSESFIQVEEGVYATSRSWADAYDRALALVKQALEASATPLSGEGLVEAVACAASPPETQDVSGLVRRLLSLSPTLARLPGGHIFLAGRTRTAGRSETADRTEAALSALGRPAHVTELVEKLAEMFPEGGGLGEGYVRNALAADRQRFVLVRKGTYGLTAWGLKKSPHVKDKLVELLSGQQEPLPYWYLRDQTLNTCNCKKAFVRMSLNLNTKLFKRFEGDRYGLREDGPSPPPGKV